MDVSAFLRKETDLLFVDSEPESLAVAEFLALLPAGRGVPVWISTWSNIWFGEGYPYRFSWLYRRAAKRALGRVSGVLCYSAEAPAVLRRLGFRGRIERTEWGVDTALFRSFDATALRRELGLDGFVAGYVGRLVPEKGVADLVRAASEIGGTALLAVGSGPMRPALKRMAGGCALPLRIVERVPHVDLPFYLNAMDVLVLPSRTTAVWKEQFGKVLVEAMACGIPAVGSSSGEIPRVIGNPALIFPEGDPRALGAILAGLRDDSRERLSLGSAARLRAETVFSWPVVARQLIGVLAAARRSAG